MGETIQIQTDRGAWGAYLARPSRAGAPAVIVLHEVFGVNADIRQTCDDLAARGFLALAPDLFWRQEPGVDLDVRTPADWDHGLALYTAYDRDAGVGDVAATLAAARSLEGASGRVGLLGYCLGGLLTFLVAARCSVDAAVAFHGADTDRYVDEAAKIDAPLLMHLGEADEFISPEAQAAIKLALRSRPSATVFSYPGCSHAFSRHGGLHYDEAAARLANGRTVAFVAEHLALGGGEVRSQAAAG